MRIGPVNVRARNPPLAGDAFVNKRLAIAYQRFYLPLNLCKQRAKLGILLSNKGGDLLLLDNLWNGQLETPKILHREFRLRSAGHEKRKILRLKQGHKIRIVAAPARFENVSVVTWLM